MSNDVDGQWTQADVDWFALNIMDNDSTDTSNDLFAMVWDYFCIAGVGDLNPAYAGVRFYPIEQGGPYTKIKLTLYSTRDLPAHPDSCRSRFGDTICAGYSTVDANEIFLNATYSSPWTLRGLGFAHELQHLCWYANGLNRAGGYSNINETLSTLGEHFAGVPRVIANYPYDSSTLRFETCDENAKYQVERIWITYLYETTEGGPGMSDDVIFRWIRDLSPSEDMMKLPALAEAAWDAAYSSATWAGGATATERLDNIFRHFAVAKFANAPSFAPNARFGIGPLNSVVDFHFFEDNCNVCCVGQSPCWNKTPMLPVDCPNWGDPEFGLPVYPPENNCCWNVRVLPPNYELGNVNENATTTVSGVYIDLDTSRDYIDVSEYGTDYITFRSGSYFENGAEHELRLTLRGAPEYTQSSWALTPFAWVLGYCCEDASLQTHPEDLRFAEPVRIPFLGTSPDSAGATIIVSDFGRGIRAVVVVVGAVSQHPDRFGFEAFPINRFSYKYTYRIDTRGAASASWGGDVFVLGDVTVPDNGSLDIGAYTHVKVNPTDLAARGADRARIEFNVEGALTADGTAADPITFASLKPTTTQDWVGFYFDGQSGGGSFDHCVLSRAEYAIESYVPLTVTNTTIEDCRYCGIVSEAGGALIQGCTLTDPGSYGIFLTAGTTVIRNTTVDAAVATALNVQPNAAATLRGSEFLNSYRGLYHYGSTNGVDVDSACVFNGNTIGVHLYNTGSSTQIRRSTISGNSSTGVQCDQGSSPAIEADTLQANGTAIYCANVSSPTIKWSVITSNANGIGVASSSNPDIGHAWTTGFNTFAYNTGDDVTNYTSSLVYAQNNCWNRTLTPDCMDLPCCEPDAGVVGQVEVSPAICCEVSQGAPLAQILPTAKPEKTVRTGLAAIVPNPFNPTTTIHYGLAVQGSVEIRVYDVAGRFVRELVNESKVAGSHEVTWDGNDRRGSSVASGVYFVRMSAGRDLFTRKMVLLK